MTDHGGGDVDKVLELANDNRLTMLTTRDEQGRLVSRPMTLQELGPDGVLWYVVDRTSPAVEQIATDSRVNVSFSGSSSWMSIAGTARLVDDRARLEELWNPVVEAWFPDGAETPEAALLTVDAESAEYWDTPGGRFASVISFVKAKVTGERYSGGESAVVDL